MIKISTIKEIPQGIPKKKDYLALLQDREFNDMRQFSDYFFKTTRPFYSQV